MADLARKAREERAGFRSKESDGFDQFLGEAKKASSSKGKWYFVYKFFISYTTIPTVRDIFSIDWEKKTLEIWGWRLRIYTTFSITI